MQVGDLIRWYNKPKHIDNIGIVIHKDKDNRVRVMWLNDQSVGWYSDSYLEEISE